MARQDALSIELLGGSAQDKLAEEYGKVIDNIQSVSLASRLKNKDLSGDPTSGTVEAKRFVNVQGASYGSARTAKAGAKIQAQPVTIAIDDDTEYVEEVEEKDLTMYGVNGLIERRTANHQNMLAVELDTKFFAKVTQGTKATPTATEVDEIVEELIQTIETTKNNFVKGVPRNMIKIVCSPAYYGKIRNKINATGNSQNLVAMSNYESGMFNNCEIFSSAFLPSTVNVAVMVDGAIAQPVRTSILNPEKIQLSDAIGFGLFAYKGTKEVMPDLIIYA